ncbi:MAG: hypothetical protein J6P31_05875 [Oscillospiraceae bacterium]|nr:hypothetical protein [Oscillospiraceae bacterium]
MYANCAASYCTRVFAEGADSFEAMKDLAFFMIDTTIRQQNSQGYWPSTAVSTWLLQDYRIGAGYYDTRFNSDFARILIAFYEQFGGDCIYDALSRYLDFYVLFVEQNAWEMFGGIVVPDYGYPGMITPHMALNHELAEMQVLYRASVRLNRPELEELADRLLTAIENSAYAWIAPDGNLHYGVFPDGRFGMWEYPYLTYNDLFEMQQLLEEKGRTRSPALDRMMDSKRVWLDRNGITEYKK